MQTKIIDLKISDIKVGTRERKDHGDLAGLAASVEEHGLLQPIGVTPDHELVFGERRLRAYRDVLGRKTIPARIVEVKSVLLGQIAENTVRKEYTVSERVAIVESLRSFSHGGDRRSKQVLGRDVEPLTVDQAAKLAGLGGKDGYFRAKAVVEKGVPELVEAMDRDDIALTAAAELAAVEPDEQRVMLAQKRNWTAKDAAAHRKRLAHRKEQEAQRTALAAAAGDRRWTVTGDQSVVPCDLLIADPPFGILDESWEPEDVEAYTKDWCKRWSACGADFIVVFWCQGRLWDGKRWFDEALEGYEFQQMLVWHANNHCGPKSRHVLKQTWYPILLYRRVGSTRQVISEGKTWDAERHQLDCCVAPVPQTGYSGDNLKLHPCQKPVPVMRWLINALSEPGDRVGSLFCGVAPCGIAAVQLGRQYHGVEADEEYRRLAEERLRAFGRPDEIRPPARPVSMNAVVEGDCVDLIPLLPDRSLDLVLTSPPYAQQRDGEYPGVPEDQYPEFTARWMAAVWDKLKDNGSVLIVIDPHVDDGVVADYVSRTQLGLREFGWREHRPFVWFKPDGPPFGHKWWPRHCYEHVLWFGKTAKPFCDPVRCGKPSRRVPQRGSSWAEQPDEVSEGVARIPDVLAVPVASNEKGVDHPARFPDRLAEILIETCSPAGGTVLDPFCGSGSALVAAQRVGRNFYGFDIVPAFCEVARKRLSEGKEPPAAKAG